MVFAFARFITYGPIRALRNVSLALLLANPASAATIAALGDSLTQGYGLAPEEGFVPQLQVFFLAMPIKSALAFLVLILYFSTILDYSHDLVSKTPEALRLLDEHWRAPAPEGR